MELASRMGVVGGYETLDSRLRGNDVGKCGNDVRGCRDGVRR